MMDRTLNEGMGEVLTEDREGRANAAFHSDHQFRFVKGLGTIDAIHNVAEDVKSFKTVPHPRQRARNRLAEDEGRKKFTSAAFLDIKGVLDSVWWPSVILSFRNKGLLEEMIEAIKRYLHK